MEDEKLNNAQELEDEQLTNVAGGTQTFAADAAANGGATAREDTDGEEDDQGVAFMICSRCGMLRWACRCGKYPSKVWSK